MIRKPARYSDKHMTDMAGCRYFAHQVYVDHFAMVEDVIRPGFFDECNRARLRQPPIRVMGRIECECADGWVMLRVMSVDEHHLNIETMPLQEPTYWADFGRDSVEDDAEAPGDGQPETGESALKPRRQYRKRKQAA
jgi:hypothetical protein